MRFDILGPLEVRDGQRPLAVGGPQQRVLLAALLLNANRAVSTDRLIGYLWGDDPPRKARGLLQGGVAQLRRALRTGQPESCQQVLVTRVPGYLVQVGPAELDLARFEELAAAAGRALADPSLAGLGQAGTLLGEALSLWRGPALDGIDAEPLRAEAASLDERRLAVLENRIDIDLRLGRGPSLVGELRQQVRVYPQRERLWAQLMLALYGADRQSDALAAYRELRQTLVEQLGVEPGATVQQLHRAILSGPDPLEVYLRTSSGAMVGAAGPARAETGPSAVAPAQLPATTAAFTGRARQVKRLDELLGGVDDGVALGVVTGTAGVGKTTLAVHWAHRVRGRFGDGQLYADLRGYARTPPARPIEVLTGFLQALGVPGDQIPVGLEAAAAQYRTQLAGKRVLVLLDNAERAEQVRPLLPGSGGCVVVVTSRDRLDGLVARDGARHLSLDVLDPDEATDLLGRALGQERVGAEPAAVAQLGRLCAGLPLALRIAAANLTLHPQHTIADQVAELASGNRLATLAVDGDEHTAVRGAFDLSYTALRPDAQRLFRLLGLVPGPDITAAGAAALTGTDPALAGRLLERLAVAHLLTEPSAGRYTCHDLLRLYAYERAVAGVAADERDGAVGRLFDWYLRSADVAARLLAPEKLRLPLPPAGDAQLPVVSFDDHGQALAWLDAERANLLAAIRYAAEHGPRPVAWLLADVLRGYFGRRMLTVDWVAAAQAGQAAAVAGGDLPGQAAAQLSLADAYNRRSEYERAIEHYGLALTLHRRAGWLEGQASVLCNSGGVFLELGRLAEAADHTAQALALYRLTGLRTGQAIALGNLACVYAELGRLAPAADHIVQALDLHRALGSDWGVAVSLGYLGELRHAQGRLDEAGEHLSEALARHREAGNRGAEAEILRVLAATHRDAGRYRQALATAQAAAALSRYLGGPRAETDALHVLGTVHQRLSQPGRAIDHHERALRLARQTRTRPQEAAALLGLATTHQQLAQLAQAREHALAALAIARAGGFGVLVAQALTTVAGIHLDLGHPDRAVTHATRALDLHRSTGHRLGEARTLLLLGRAHDRAGAVAAAVAHWRRAHALFTEIGAPEAGEVHTILHRAGGGPG